MEPPYRIIGGLMIKKVSSRIFYKSIKKPPVPRDILSKKSNKVDEALIFVLFARNEVYFCKPVLKSVYYNSRYLYRIKDAKKGDSQ